MMNYIIFLAFVKQPVLISDRTNAGVFLRSSGVMPRAKSPKNGNSRSKTSTSQPLVVNEVRMNRADLESEIRQRAYELSARRGFEPGHEDEDWLTAEREVLTRN